ncbi:MAG: DUF87 domain-containing protein, partial [Candidatus Eisenbacteria bacterium]
MSRGSHFVRRLFRGDESARAREWQSRALAQSNARDHEDVARFRAVMACKPGDRRVLLGRARDLSGEPFWCGLPYEEFLGQHSWITGATGSGKTFATIAWLLQVLRDGRFPVIVVDLKSELSELLIELVVPSLLQTRGGQTLLNRLRIIRPFGHDLPMLRVTEAERGVPRAIQAFNLASALEDALADDLGSRMTRVFLRLCALAIELGYPLTAIQRWLESPEAFERDARRSSDPTVREYARSGFARESRPAVDALLARLDTFLFLDEVKLALSAPRCVNFSEALESGLTIVDLGSPPAGAERAQRFWAGILTGRITRAILSRPVTEQTPQTWVIFEEVQEALGSGQAEQFARLLALARHKRCAVTLINQQPAQLAAVDSTLVKVLRTNAGIECAFRANIEDAKTLVHALPVPPRQKNAAEGRLALVTELTQMPDREYLLWLKQAPFRAQHVRSPRLDLARLREVADRLDPGVRAALRRGVVSMDRAALEAHA